ncbi:MAG TPA: flagellar biosynthetic protein FliO [Clostridia bacterium]|nr:flagellar biosynthetic protein FliO [Clostridia bacterium]
MWLQVLGVLMVLAAIIFLSYVTTRYYGGKTRKAMKGNYIKIVESVSLGLDKNLHLVKVEDQFVLIATSGKNIEYLTTINIEGYEEQKAVESNSPFDFKNLFDKYIQAYKNRSGAKPKKNSAEREKSEGFDNADERAVLKENLNRLRTINSRVNYKSKNDEDVDTYEK